MIDTTKLMSVLTQCPNIPIKHVVQIINAINGGPYEACSPHPATDGSTKTYNSCLAGRIRQSQCGPTDRHSLRTDYAGLPRALSPARSPRAKGTRPHESVDSANRLKFEHWLRTELRIEPAYTADGEYAGPMVPALFEAYNAGYADYAIQNPLKEQGFDHHD